MDMIEFQGYTYYIYQDKYYVIGKHIYLVGDHLVNNKKFIKLFKYNILVIPVEYSEVFDNLNQPNYKMRQSSDYMQYRKFIDEYFIQDSPNVYKPTGCYQLVSYLKYKTLFVKLPSGSKQLLAALAAASLTPAKEPKCNFVRFNRSNYLINTSDCIAICDSLLVKNENIFYK